ncbi:hypothetical protein BJX61DRAFT_523707 [Aspergillus egyptiacus]|nr:hypothetical protein BJX61DRAFT_523707 [Aspergillus egyptiacus]
MNPPANSPPNSMSADYPWTSSPLIVSAPMAKIATPRLAVAVSKAGGLGFIAAGYQSDNLENLLKEADDLLLGEESPPPPPPADTPPTTPEQTSNEKEIKSPPKSLPVGVGFITWSASLETALPALSRYCPAAVWLFAPPTGFSDLIPWATKVRQATGSQTKIWVQVGSVRHAVQAVEAIEPDVVVVQGLDAGGHGLARGASIVSLVPEVVDNLREWRLRSRPGNGKQIEVVAAGGIGDCRGVAAAVALGAGGVVLGTRFLASVEAMVARGYQRAILEAWDGGVSTVRTTIYDKVRGIHGWPEGYDGRGLINKTFVDHQSGLGEVENRELYREELDRGDGEGYGADGRLTTYAGTGVGLIRKVSPAGEIVRTLREGACAILYGQHHPSKL